MVDIVTRAGKGSPLTNNEVDANFTNLAEVSGITGEPMGHEDRTTSTISFNASTRTFTIAPVSTSFTVWCKGKKVVVSSAQTVTIPNTSGMYSIYFDANGALAAKAGYFTFSEEAPTAYIYWNAATGACPYFGDERHGVVLDWQTHEYLHRTRGAALASGFGASGYTLGGNGSSNAHAQLTLEGGTFFDEDMKIIVTATNTPTAGTWEQDLLSPARIPVLYLSGTGWVIDAPTDYPLKQGTARPQYNALSGGVWSTADVANNKYATSWILATNNLTYPVIAIIGQAESDLQSAAEAVDFTSLQLPGFPSVEFRPLYRLVFQCADSFSNAVKASLVSITDIRSIAAAGVAASLITDHGNLSGLSDDDHPQYLSVDTVRGTLTAEVKASFLPSQAGNAGKFLTTDATSTSWAALTSGNITTALGFTPYNATNPAGYITGITSSDVTTALGFTPYNATNPSGFVTAAGARGAISVTGAGSYDSATGVINIVGGVTSFNTRTGAITLSSADVTTALGFTPYNSTNPNGYLTGITSTQVTTALGYTPYNSSNPSGYITGITSGMVTTALGFTPYNNSNPSGYITSSALSGYLTSASAASTYLPLAGGTLTGPLAINGSVLTTTAASSWGVYSNTNGANYSGIWFSTNVGELLLRKADGTLSTRIAADGSFAFINGNNILHAANYNSYSPTLTGTGASGTWGISITGNAATATSASSAATAANVASGEISNLNTAWTAPGTSIGNGFRVYRYQVGATGQPEAVDNANWLINIYSHPSGGTASYGHQLSGTDTENIWMRTVNNGGFGTWRVLVHSGNYNSYALPLSGGTMTGSILVSGLGVGAQFGNLSVGYGGAYNTLQTKDGSSILYLQAISTGGIDLGSGGGFTTINQSTRSPIFYDSNDTTYYGDFASSSWGVYSAGGGRFRNIQISDSSYTDTIQHVTSGNQIWLQYSHSGNVGLVYGGGSVSIGNIASPSFPLHVKKNANQVAGFESPNANTWVDIISTTRTWSIGSTGSSTFAIYDRASNVTRAEVDTGSNFYAYGSSRSPIFYDSDNTARYIDPNGTSVLNAANWYGVQNWAGDGAYARGTPTHGFRFNNSADTINAFIVSNSGNTTSYSSSRAPIFYDSDNTSYYVDPNSDSRLSELSVGRGPGGSNAGNLYIKGNNSWRWIAGYAPDYGVGNGFGLYSDTNAAYYLSLSTAGNWWFGVNDHSSSYRVSINGTGYASGDFRAPIFYDSNDTSYYLDPNSTGLALATNGIVSSGTGTNGGFQNRTFTSGRNRIWSFGNADTYGISYFQGGPDYIGLHVSGTATQGGSDFWVSSQGVSQTSVSSRAPIFYDSNNTAYYVDPNGTSVLTTAIFYVNGSSDITLTSAGTNASMIKAGSGDELYVGGNNTWQMRFSGANVLMDNGGYLLNGESIRSPIFYDSNNTNYYLDPTSNSVLNYANYQAANGGSNANGVVAIKIAGLSNYDSLELGVQSNYSGFLRTYGNDLHYYSGHWRTAGNVSSEDHQHYWYTSKAGSANWSTWKMQLNHNADFLVTGSVRAPVFYDYENTAYYCDPSSSSYLYGLVLSGNQYFRPNTWIQCDSSAGIYWPNHYGAHFYPNGGSTYTQLQIDGSKNSYSGMYLSHSAVNGMMYDSAGNGGVYREANGKWYFYYLVSNDCMGIGTSSTNSAYGVYCNKGAYFGARVDGTIFYDANSTSYYLDPSSSGLSLSSAGVVSSGTGGGFQNAGYQSGRNRIWSFGNADSYGISYFQGGGGYGGSDSMGMHFGTTSADCNFIFRSNSDFIAKGNVTAYSDERLKTDWSDVCAGFVEALAKVKSGTYTRTDTGARQAGVSAQSLQTVLPETVLDEGPHLAVAYGNAAMVSAVELAKEVVDLRNRVAQLESLINKLIGD